VSTPLPPGQSAAPLPKGSSGDPVVDALIAQNKAMMGAISGANAGKINDNSIIHLPGFSSPTMSYSPTMAYSQARLLPVQWMESDPSKLKQLVNTGILNKVPGFNPGMGMPEIISAWDELVKASYEVNQSNGKTKNYTPWDILNTYSNPKSGYGTVKDGDWLYDSTTGEKVKYVGPKSKTTTNRDVNLSSAEDVKALTTSVLTQALGRAPTAAEVAQYKSTINAQENANPALTTTTQTFDDQGNAVSQSSKETGGFDASAQQQLVQDQAAKSPEFAKYQSGTTYWNAMMQMLSGG